MGTMKPSQGKKNLSIIIVVTCTFAFIALLYTERISSLSPSLVSKLKSCSKTKTGSESNNHTSGASTDKTAYDNLGNSEADDRFEFDPTECSLVDGKWVFNRSVRPLYSDRTCPYLDKQVSCVTNGRPDSDYRHWEWQLDDCLLPRFNPEVALEKLRGKRLMFVGDSLQRGQWQSFVCLVEFIIPQDQKSMRRGRSLSVFKAKVLKLHLMPNFDKVALINTIESDFPSVFFHLPIRNTMLQLSSIGHRFSSSPTRIIAYPKERILRVDSVSKHAKHWIGVDILVFNTYVWWLSGLRIKSLSADWNNKDGIKCYNETKPVLKKRHWGTGSDKRIMKVVDNIVEKMKVPVTLINITQMSEHQIDGHSSIYTETQGKLLTDEHKANPLHYADCIHWCLPGVPDTWNQAFLAYL